MKKNYKISTALFLCLLPSTHITSSSGHGDNNISNMSPTISPNVSPNVSPTISPNISPTISPIINIFIGITQEVATNIQTYVSNKFKMLQEAAQNAYENTSASVSALQQWASNNKLKLAFYTTASLYSYITYKLFILKYHLIQTDNWSLWNNGLSLDELMSIPQNKLGEILVKEAQQRYTLIDDPENFITPIITFLQTVEQEKKMLEGYVALCSWITTVKLSKLFWFDENLFFLCRERLKRLAYIRAVFVNWITEYKFIHNAAPTAA